MVFDPISVTFVMTLEAEEFQKLNYFQLESQVGLGFPTGLKAHFASTCICSLFKGVCCAAVLKCCRIHQCWTGPWLSQNINILDLSCSNYFVQRLTDPHFIVWTDSTLISLSINKQGAQIQKSGDCRQILWRRKGLLVLWVWTLRVWLHEPCSWSSIGLQTSQNILVNLIHLNVTSPPFSRDLEMVGTTSF